MIVERPLVPFGLEVTLPEGTSWDELDPQQLRTWIDRHRVLLLRGLAPLPPHALAKAARALGPLQPWPFGAVHEIVRDPQAENYLYTEHEVPLHWDGAFADAVPHWLVFRCVAAPPAVAGGETTFVDTTRVLAQLPAATRAQLEPLRVRYTTEKKAHYGGSFVAPVVAMHPTLHEAVLRYAEPVDDLNPVRVEVLGCTTAQGTAITTELRAALHDPRAVLTLPWRDGDVLIADNHALLHGRRAFHADAPRHLLRVNVLDPRRAWWHPLRDAWRLRRPEFMRAEIPILFVPALLCATRVAELGRATFWAGVALFWLLFQIGDLVNCLLDTEVDLHRKTHLSEAVRALGRGNIVAQIGVSIALVLGLAAYLTLVLSRPWMGIAALVGVVLGASYTAAPLRLKGRGLWQLVAYVGLLFVGPMTLVAGLFRARPPTEVLLVALAYGLMQSGVLLVNTAEDLDEDEREGIRTVAVALGAAGTMRVGRWLAAGGAAALLAVFAHALPAWAWPALGPLAVVLVYNDRWLRMLAVATRKTSEPNARTLIRKQGKHVPRHIEAGAWTALVAAAVVFATRCLS